MATTAEILSKFAAEYRTMQGVEGRSKAKNDAFACDGCGRLGRTVRCDSCWRLIADAIEAAAIKAAPVKFCDQCPHALALHNPDGSCPCGMDCAKLRAAGATP